MSSTAHHESNEISKLYDKKIIVRIYFMHANWKIYNKQKNSSFCQITFMVYKGKKIIINLWFWFDFWLPYGTYIIIALQY